MSATNNCNLIGRLTNDPTIDGIGETKRAKFRIAVDRSKDKTDFLPCTAWGPTAEFLVKYFHKGDPIAVNGEITASTLERDGTTRTFYDIRVSGVSFVPGSRNGESQGTPKRGGGEFISGAGARSKQEPEPDDEESPF